MATLIADDNSEIRGALALLLRELGELDILEASDIAGALEVCRGREPAAAPGGEPEAGGKPEAAPGLVVLDWELPVGPSEPADPAEFVATLRQIAPGCRIIAMSARPEAEDEALMAGCDAFVSRTDPPDRLVTLLSDCAAL